MELERRADMLGNVWTALGADTGDNQSSQDLQFKKRTILTGVRVLKPSPFTSGVRDLEVGCFCYVKPDHGEMVVKCKNNGWVSVGGVKVEGKKEVEGGEWVRGLQRRGVGKKFSSMIDRPHVGDSSWDVTRCKYIHIMKLSYLFPSRNRGRYLKFHRTIHRV
jgi:hypothetical protein